jgi:hypothetical protein
MHGETMKVTDEINYLSVTLDNTGGWSTKIIIKK